MNITTQSAETLRQEPGRTGMLELVELAGRTCYKSQDRISMGSAEKFVGMLKESGHLSVLEHGTLYLDIPVHRGVDWREDVDHGENALICMLEEDPFSRVNYDGVGGSMRACVTTNYRVIVENGIDEEMVYKHLVGWDERFDRRVTVRIVTSMGISRELNRHRCHSISEQSTRYCNYSKDKFENELTFILPGWASESEAAAKYGDAVPEWMEAMQDSEAAYMHLLDVGLAPQEAREVLPLSLATETVHTAYLDDWMDFFKQRCDKRAHPDMQVLANMIKSGFEKEGLIR